MRRSVWLSIQVIVSLAIIAAVGWHFADLLQHAKRSVHFAEVRWDWAAFAAALYLVGQTFAALFFGQLVYVQGERPSVLAVARAFFCGQLAKYLPGRVWPLAVRGAILRSHGVHFGVATMSATFEGLITAAGGAIIGLLALATGLAPIEARWTLYWLIILPAVAMVPVVFRLLVRRFGRRRDTLGMRQFADLPSSTYGWGLAASACNWALQGAGLWALLHAALPAMDHWPNGTWQCCIAINALAYTGGFATVVLPTGLGVRDFLMQQFLLNGVLNTIAPSQQAATAVTIALLFRLICLVAEVIAAGVLCCVPNPATIAKHAADQRPQRIAH